MEKITDANVLTYCALSKPREYTYRFGFYVISATKSLKFVEIIYNVSFQIVVGQTAIKQQTFVIQLATTGLATRGRSSSNTRCSPLSLVRSAYDLKSR